MRCREASGQLMAALDAPAHFKLFLTIITLLRLAMAARRAFNISPPNISPRNSMDPSNHPAVDSVLKDLKQCARRLQAALASQHVELQVLEMLYYKGNNQHRTALFWRRVSDMRRFGRRLEGANLHALVDGVRMSFWGIDMQPK